jgi:hypothetical protein
MSLAGGGVPVEDLSQGYPEAEWDTVLGDMFLESLCQNRSPITFVNFGCYRAMSDFHHEFL